MRFLLFFYRIYLGLGSLALALPLYIGGWKKAVLLANARRCGLAVPFIRFRWYIHVALDFLSFAHGIYGTPIRIRACDKDKLKKLKSSPGVFLTAHFHQWELMGGWLVRQGVPLLSAARPMTQPWAQSLLTRFRSRISSRTVESHIPRTALRHLDRNGCFALLWDQRVSGSPVRAPFFGASLGMDPLPPFLIRHRNCAVWFGTLLPDGTFRLLLLSPGTSSPSANPRPASLSSTPADPTPASPAALPPPPAPDSHLVWTSEAGSGSLILSTPASTSASAPSTTPELIHPTERPSRPGLPLAPPSSLPFTAPPSPSSLESSSTSIPISPFSLSSRLIPGSSPTYPFPLPPNPFPLSSPPAFPTPFSQREAPQAASHSSSSSATPPPNPSRSSSPIPGPVVPRSPDRIARRYHRVLELLIRRHPTWWYGMAHRRFLEAPDQSPGSDPGVGVSRETLVASGVMVSRETNLSD